MIFATPAYLLTGLVILVGLLVLLRRQKYSLSYLFLFSLFGLYLLMVLSVIIFPIAPLPAAYQDAFRLRTNLVPFEFGGCYVRRICIANILGNILLTVPIGFGIPFLIRLPLRLVLGLAVLLGMMFETLQLVIALLFKSAFRVIDINDVIFNAAGVCLGYLLFKLFGLLYLFVTRQFGLRHRFLFAYVYEVIRRS